MAPSPVDRMTCRAVSAIRARVPSERVDSRCPARDESGGPDQGRRRSFPGAVPYNVSVQVSMRPTSCAAASCTRRVHVPVRASADRFTG